MDHKYSKPVEHLPDVAKGLVPQDLCDVIRYLIDRGDSEFLYDEELDVFRFSEDGRFAFCDEFANWALLDERGWLDF